MERVILKGRRKGKIIIIKNNHKKRNLATVNCFPNSRLMLARPLL